MKNIQDKELKRETIIAKFIKKLKMIENDHDVIDYNFYSDKSFAGVKIMRNKKITLDELAAIVIEGFARQEVYNKKIDKIEADIVELKRDVVEIKQDIVEIRKDLNEVRELPIIKEALKNSKKGKQV